LVVDVISGAVGRTEGFGSEGGGAGTAFPAAGACAVGGPIEIGGMAGRCCLPVLGPMSIDRVTTTAGVPAGAVTITAGGAGDAAGGAAAGGAAAGEGAAGIAGGAAGEATGAGGPAGEPAGLAALGDGEAGAPLGDDACAGERGCGADFGDGEAAFCDDAGLGGCCAWGAPALPSFGGRCIDGPSSAVFGDVASVSLLGLPEKSLEKTLIAECPR
jgi:hypothetical protein